MPDANASPESRVLINDVAIAPELRVDILEIMVAQHVEGGDLFDIKINAVNSENQQIKWIDSDDLSPGNRIEIQCGYRGELTTLLKGEITALKVDYGSDQPTVMRLQGFDRLHRLRRGRKTRAFNEIKDSQLAERIAREMNLTPEVQDSGIVHPYLLQNNLSDIDFLLMRARRIRYEVLVTGSKLIFREAKNNLGESVSLEYPKDLKWFRPRMSTANVVSELTVRGWNPATKAAILGVARGGDQTSLMGGHKAAPALTETAFGKTADVIVEMPVATQAEADQIAKALYNEMALGLISGDGEAVGNASLMPGTTARLNGLGTRFSGVYYIRRAEHRIAPKTGYVTAFQVVRNAS
ncbi:phage late control D family protein [Bradyrhizobium sp. HKCCYLS20291]|uniref:phage late control D family protein n=1 Tax=Bradyrhizobium sp. HKCCYLS20291 TaxID=3420766 RepID=UPI003EBD53CC